MQNDCFCCICYLLVSLLIYLFMCLSRFSSTGPSSMSVLGEWSFKSPGKTYHQNCTRSLCHILHHPRMWRPIGIGAAKVHHGDDLRGSPKAGYATHHRHHLVHGNEVTKQPRSVQGFEPRRLQALPVMQKGLLKCWWVGVLKLAVLHHDRPLC